MVVTDSVGASSYRCYLLNADNSFRNAQEFRGADDDEAKRRAVAWLQRPENAGAQGLELWKRQQRILIHRRGAILAPVATD